MRKNELAFSSSGIDFSGSSEKFVEKSWYREKVTTLKRASCQTELRRTKILEERLFQRVFESIKIF